MYHFTSRLETGWLNSRPPVHMISPYPYENEKWITVQPYPEKGLNVFTQGRSHAKV
jgi:hypothetical protein